MKKLDDPSVFKSVAKALELAELTCPDTMVPKTYYDHLAQAAITAIREALQLTEDEAWQLSLAKEAVAPPNIHKSEHTIAWGIQVCLASLGLIKGEEQQ